MREMTTGKEDEAMKKQGGGYAGKIKSGGTQNVKAPFGGGNTNKGSQIKRGEDLRTKKSK